MQALLPVGVNIEWLAYRRMHDWGAPFCRSLDEYVLKNLGWHLSDHHSLLYRLIPDVLAQASRMWLAVTSLRGKVIADAEQTQGSTGRSFNLPHDGHANGYTWNTRWDTSW